MNDVISNPMDMQINGCKKIRPVLETPIEILIST